MKNSIMAFCACLLAAVMFSSCSNNEPNQEGVGSENQEAKIISDIKANGKLVVYTNPEFPPYEYLGANGALIGCELDIVERVAEKLGVKAEIVSAEFDSIIGSVQAHKADLGASGFTITEERQKIVSFSIPFDRSVQYLIVDPKSTIANVEDLAGKVVGGQQGTTGCMIVEDAVSKGILKNTGATVKVYNNAPDAVTAMQAGQVDAVVIDKLVALSLAKKNNLKCFELLCKDGKGLLAAEEFGMIVAKGNEALLDVVNSVIREMIDDGSYDACAIKHQDASSN